MLITLSLFWIISVFEFFTLFRSIPQRPFSSTNNSSFTGVLHSNIVFISGYLLVPVAATRASSSNGCLRWVSYWMARLSATIIASPGLTHHRIVNALLSQCEWDSSLKQLRTCLTKTSTNFPTMHFLVTLNTRNVSTKYFYTSPDGITVGGCVKVCGDYTYNNQIICWQFCMKFAFYMWKFGCNRQDAQRVVGYWTFCWNCVCV